jgi:hypothetical protein
MVSQERIDKFKALYLRKYNIKLTNEEAIEMGNGLVNLLELLLKPNKREK